MPLTGNLPARVENNYRVIRSNETYGLRVPLTTQTETPNTSPRGMPPPGESFGHPAYTDIASSVCCPLTYFGGRWVVVSIPI